MEAQKWRFCRQRNITRKALGTAKLKLQSLARAPAQCVPGKRRRLVKHMRMLLRGLPILGAKVLHAQRPPALAHAPRTLQFSRWTAPRTPSMMELMPSDVVHHYVVPYVSDPKPVLALFISSRLMLEKGISMLGCVRIERLDRVWWKLQKVRIVLQEHHDPITVDSSSESEISEDEATRDAVKRRKLAMEAREPDTVDTLKSVESSKRSPTEPEPTPPLRKKRAP